MFHSYFSVASTPPIWFGALACQQRVSHAAGGAVNSVGEILVDGDLTDKTAEGNLPYSYVVAAFSASGKIDAGFGKNGTAIGGFTEPFITTPDYAVVDGLAIQSDGKPLILSLSDEPTGGFGTYVTRLTTTGALDTTFSPPGPAGVLGLPTTISYRDTPDGGQIYVTYTDDDRNTPHVARWVAEETDPAPTILTGKAIGTGGSFHNLGNTIANVFDSNVDSFFDAPSSTGAWVGLDLGSATTVKQIQYVPRTGFESRMVGGEFQASNSADFSSGVVTLAKVSSTPPAGAPTVLNFSAVSGYRFFRYMGA